MRKLTIYLSYLAIYFFTYQIQAESFNFHTLIQGGLVSTGQETDILEPWFDQKTGLTRFYEQSPSLKLFQAAFEIQWQLHDDYQFHLTSMYYPDGDKHLGITEAYIDYRPLMPSWKFRYRLGAFYPEYTFEHPGIAWSNPYTFTYSAANSWIAEELRIIGFEGQLSRPGRPFKTPWSHQLSASIFHRNDGLGTLLPWRGWALHDRQTLLGERIRFANYPGFTDRLSSQPNWVQPFEETDHQLGFAMGYKLDYLTRISFKAYYYNNQGNAHQVESSGQYAWDTEFLNLAVQYRPAFESRLIAQWMSGKTVMGENVVGSDFYTYSVLASHKIDQQRVSVRYDHFSVKESDDYSMDPNDSDGHAWTIAWRFHLNKGWSVGAEWLHIQSKNSSRTLWPVDAQASQNQLRLLLEYQI